MFAATTFAASASAQTVNLATGVSLSRTTFDATANYNTINLGSTATSGLVSQMPLSLSYATVNVGVQFNGSSGVYGANTSWNPTPGSNYFRTNDVAGASIALNFSSAQNYFGVQWGTPDNGAAVRFFNGSQLVATATRASATAAGIPWTQTGSYASFNFNEGRTFDRVEISTTAGGFEFGAVSFNTANAAPLPIGGVGGVLALFGMMARRGRRPSWMPRWAGADALRGLRLKTAS